MLMSMRAWFLSCCLLQCRLCAGMPSLPPVETLSDEDLPHGGQVVLAMDPRPDDGQLVAVEPAPRPSKKRVHYVEAAASKEKCGVALLGEAMCHRAFRLLVGIAKSRLQRLRKAILEGAECCPHDNRYVPKKGLSLHKNKARAAITEFLMQCYHVQAEPLPEAVKESEMKAGLKPGPLKRRGKRPPRAAGKISTAPFSPIPGSCGYWRLRGLSRLRQLSDGRQVVCVAIDTVDHSKFVVPKSLAMQAKDFSQFLKPSLTVTASLIHGVACIIHIAKPHICKDSSYTTEIVAHTCKVISETDGIYMPQICVHFCGDNSSRELKNNSVVRLLSGMVSCGRVRVASLQTLESGHSHEDIDQMFSSLAAWIMGQNELHTTTDFEESISGTSHYSTNRAKKAGEPYPPGARLDPRYEAVHLFLVQMPLHGAFATFKAVNGVTVSREM
eukprot:s301_g11.t1